MTRRLRRLTPRSLCGLILQKLGSLVCSEFNIIHRDESGELDIFPGINKGKWVRSFGFVAGVLGGLNEGDEIVTGSYKTLRTLKNGASVKVDNTPAKKTEEPS